MTGSHEVRGSIPLGSTKFLSRKKAQKHTGKRIDEIENGIVESHLRNQRSCIPLELLRFPCWLSWHAS
jgi:hypothetical protein